MYGLTVISRSNSADSAVRTANNAVQVQPSGLSRNGIIFDVLHPDHLSSHTPWSHSPGLFRERQFLREHY